MTAFGFEQVEVITKDEDARGRKSFVNGQPRAIRLVGGPRDGEIVDSRALMLGWRSYQYAEVTACGDTERIATWSPINRS